LGRPRLLYRLALEPVRTPETRLMVIETERAVMPDHGEMYTPALVEFLVRLVNARISAAGARAAPDSAARSR
jgi:hypothetical protein